MERFKLATDMWIAAPLDKVWDFAKQPQNLASITPRFYAIDVDPQARTENGAQFAIRFHPLGLPTAMTWVAEISEVQNEGPLRQFVDVQTKGPFSLWKHTHIFEAGAPQVDGLRSNSKVKAHEPGTWIRDRLEYALPLGRAGDLAHRAVIRRQLGKMFLHRREKLKELLG